GCGSLGGTAPAATSPAGARSGRSTATAIPDPRGSLVRPAPRDPPAGSGPPLSRGQACMGLFVSSGLSLSHPHRSCTAGGRGNGLSENADLLLSIVTVAFPGGWPVSRSTAYSFGLLMVLCSERDGRSSSRRLRSGSWSARKASRDRNASAAWRHAALAEACVSQRLDA